MDVREKLVDMLREASYECDEGTRDLWDMRQVVDGIADFLIAHGVTVQEWISVKDRLPEEECRCLVIDAAGDIEMDCYDGKGRFVLDRSGAVQHPSHWMPLPKMPQPPKGE